MNNPKESVLVDHRIKNLIEVIQKDSMDALILVNDNDGLKRDELLVLQGKKPVDPEEKNPDVFKNFYARYKEITDYNKKFSA